jgi:hypothetical protein
MRLSTVLLLCAVTGVHVGAWLVGVWMVGVVVMVDSLVVGGWALLRDVPERKPVVPEGTLESVLDRARRAS